MPTALAPQTLKKEERICSKKLIETLFDSTERRSLAAFPLRAVWLLQKQKEGKKTAFAPVEILISVSKRRLRHAVDRNRTKRQVREAYRKHKHILWKCVPEGHKAVLGFLWLDGRLHDSCEVENRVVNLLRRISEKL